jgi:hypothetical protein
MKARIFQRCGLALILALIPLFGGCDQERANSATVTNVAASDPPAEAVAGGTNQADSTTTNQDLADAPGHVISTPDMSSTNTSSNPRLDDLVKLVQAGMGDSVLLAYVTNSAAPFNVSSDDILYLNDLGTPESVVGALLQRDQYFNSAMPAPATAVPQPQNGYAGQAAQTPESPSSTAYTDENAVAQTVEPPLTPSPGVMDDAQEAPNGSYSYFYDSLSPYGSWIDIDGYGPCWQPTAVVANPGWQPYCDRGHWAYTDCGWCWDSDYSWGWAPFHYGRWFHHNRWGWCWAPDTEWGPAWVSWRYNNAYCGWAPLPPSACYRPGFGFTYFGRSVGFNFGFGLAADRYVFVPLGHFHDRFPDRFRLPHREVTRIYNGTAVHNQIIRGAGNNLINRGIPVDRVAAAAHTEIHPIHIRANADRPRAAELGRDGRSLSVYRPALPTPRPGNANRLVGEGGRPDPRFNLHAREQRPPVARMPVNASAPDRRPIISNPTAMGNADIQARDNRFPQTGGERPGSLILHGPNRAFPPQTPVQSGRVDERNPVPQQREWQQRTFQQQPRDSQPQRDAMQQGQQQMEWQQQRDQQRALPQREWQQPVTPRQDAAPRTFGSPRMNDQNFDPGFRSEPAVRSEQVIPQQPRVYEQRQAPEARSAPQSSGPAREEGGQGGRGGGGNGGGGGRGNR